MLKKARRIRPPGLFFDTDLTAMTPSRQGGRRKKFSLRFLGVLAFIPPFVANVLIAMTARRLAA
jgi:hypothetical protein